MGPFSSQAIAEVLRQGAHAAVYLGVALWDRSSEKQESGLACAPAQCVCDCKVSSPGDFSLADDCEKTLGPFVRGYVVLTFAVGFLGGAAVLLGCQFFVPRRGARRAPPRRGHGVVVSADFW